MRRRFAKFAAIALAGALAIQAPITAFAAEASVTRLAGNDRFETMSKIVDEGFTSSEWAIVASGDTFPDSLAAAGIAGAYDAPIILTAKVALSPAAKQQLERLGVKNAIILGGTGAVSADVESSIKEMGIQTERLAGDTRVQTSVLASQKAMERLGEVASRLPDRVVIASAANYPDGLSASSYAYAKDYPVLLVDPSGLTDDARQFLRDGQFTLAVVMGGTAVVPEAVEQQIKDAGSLYTQRVEGEDRYATSLNMASYAASEGLSRRGAVVASGENFPDALAGGSLAGSRGSVLVLVNGNKTDNAALNAIVGSGSATVLGGTSVISDAVFSEIQGCVAYVQEPDQFMHSQVGDYLVTSITGQENSHILGVQNGDWRETMDGIFPGEKTVEEQGPHFTVWQHSDSGNADGYACGNGAYMTITVSGTGDQVIKVPNEDEGKPVVYINFQNFTVGGGTVTLDVSDCKSLRALELHAYDANNLSVVFADGDGAADNLEYIFTLGVTLDSFDVSQLSKLSYLNINNNTEFVGSPVIASNSLSEIQMFYSSVDQSMTVNCPNLKYMIASECSIKSLDVSGSSALNDLNVMNNRELTSLTLGSHPSLRGLVLDNNSLTSLDISGCSSLESLSCTNNCIKDLSALEQWAAEGEGRYANLTPQRV